MKKKYWFFVFTILAIIGFWGFKAGKKFNFNTKHKVGDVIDSLNGVHVYFNGGVDHILDRNTSPNGYNIGLRYQCVEFVKRYYYEYLEHEMPDSYGHAKDFFNPNLKDGTINPQRNLIQYTNSSQAKPKVNDLLVYGPTPFNQFGHVAIISKVTETEIEIIQQNPGPFGNSRETYPIKNVDGLWTIQNKQILGWLSKIENH